MLEQLLCNWCFIDDDQVQALNNKFDFIGDHPVNQQYGISKTIGYGAFAKVCLAKNLQSGETYALKVVYKKNPKIKNRNLQVLLNEKNILQQLNHPNIIQVVDVVENERQMVMILEYLRGGELLQHIHQFERYTEGEAAYLFQQIASAVAHLHQSNVIHRDIKPENVLFANKVDSTLKTKEDLQLKIIDLGMACYYDVTKNQKQQGCIGSPGFVAPEIIRKQHHTPAMDMFSLGVLLFIMLCGKYPMYLNQAAKLIYSNIQANAFPNMKDQRFQRLSDQAKDLIYRLLQNEPSDRINSQQVMEHCWITSMGGSTPRELDKRLICREIKNVIEARRKWRGAINGLIAVNRFWNAFRQKDRSTFLNSHISFITETQKNKKIQDKLQITNAYNEKDNLRKDLHDTLKVEDIENQSNYNIKVPLLALDMLDSTNNSKNHIQKNFSYDVNNSRTDQTQVSDSFHQNKQHCMGRSQSPINSQKACGGIESVQSFMKQAPIQQHMERQVYKRKQDQKQKDIEQKYLNENTNSLRAQSRLYDNASDDRKQFQDFKRSYSDKKKKLGVQFHKDVSQVFEDDSQMTHQQLQGANNRLAFKKKASKSFNTTGQKQDFLQQNQAQKYRQQQYLYFDKSFASSKRRLMWQKGAYHLSLERVQQDIDFSFGEDKAEIKLARIDSTLLNNSEPKSIQKLIGIDQYDTFNRVPRSPFYEGLPQRSMETAFDLKVSSTFSFKVVSKRMSQSTFFSKRKFSNIYNG